MRLLLIKERLFLFGEFPVSKSQYLYNNELFGTEIDLSDTNQQRGRQTRPKHHT